MRWISRRRLIMLAGVVACLASAEMNLQVVKGFRYPEYDGAGRLKLEVMGDEASLQPDGRVKITNLRMVFYEEGRTAAEVTAPECLFDRVNHAATSTSRVTIARAEATLTGEGFEWSAATGCFTIHNRAKVVLSETTMP